MASNDSTAESADGRGSSDDSPDPNADAPANGDSGANAPADGDSGANAPADGDSGANAPADGDSGANASPDPSVPEGFGEVPDDRKGSRWTGYALAGLLAAVFLVGLVRLTAPNVSNLLVATLLTLFGFLVGLLAVRDRLRGS